MVDSELLDNKRTFANSTLAQDVFHANIRAILLVSHEHVRTCQYPKDLHNQESHKNLYFPVKKDTMIMKKIPQPLTHAYFMTQKPESDWDHYRKPTTNQIAEVVGSSSNGYIHE
ncbi:hypothetical protein STEG23_025736 [Scotinomys teguina]